MARRTAFDGALRAAIEALGLQHVELADEIGVSPRSIGRWIAGDVVPVARIRARLVTALARRDPATAEKVAASLGMDPPPAPTHPDETAPEIEALDAAVYLAADALGVPAGAARPVLGRFLGHLAAARIDLGDARRALTTSASSTTIAASPRSAPKSAPTTD